jgi:hypothetical protein
MATSQLDAIVNQVKLLPPEALVQLIRRVAEILEQKQAVPAPTQVDYLALIGSGRGAFASAAEADQFLREERDGWER